MPGVYSLNAEAVPRLEVYQWAYRDYLKAHLEESLGVERAFWAAAPYNDDLALPMPADSEWRLGSIPDDVLPFVVKSLPTLTFEAVNLTPGTEDLTAAVNPLLIGVWVGADDPETANKLLQRTAHAVLMVVASDWPLIPSDPIKWVKGIAENLTATEITGRSAYIKGGHVVVPLGIAADL